MVQDISQLKELCGNYQWQGFFVVVLTVSFFSVVLGKIWGSAKMKGGEQTVLNRYGPFV